MVLILNRVPVFCLNLPANEVSLLGALWTKLLQKMWFSCHSPAAGRISAVAKIRGARNTGLTVQGSSMDKWFELKVREIGIWGDHRQKPCGRNKKGHLYAKGIFKCTFLNESCVSKNILFKHASAFLQKKALCRIGDETICWTTLAALCHNGLIVRDTIIK